MLRDRKDRLNIRYFIAFNCSRQPICFQPRRGLTLAKGTKKRQLSRSKQYPIIIALPFNTGFTKISQPKEEAGLLITTTRPGKGQRLCSPDTQLQVKRVIANIFQTPYLRTGLEVSIFDETGNALTAPAFKKKHDFSDPYHINIGFFAQSSDLTASERFYLVPINSEYLDRRFQERCKRWLYQSQFKTQGHLIPQKYSQDSIEQACPRAKQARISVWRNRTNRGVASQKSKYPLPGRVYRAGKKWDYLGWDRYATLCTPVDRDSLAWQKERTLTIPSKGPCIVATAKNEGLYIAHWCAYHLALGFDHIYLYTNDNNDKTIEIASRVSELTGRVTVINNSMGDQRTRPQFKAYKHALSISEFPLHHSWCAIIDIDEYIAIKPGQSKQASILGLIEWIQSRSFLSPDIIALNWVFAGFDKNFTKDCDPLPCLPSRIRSALGKNQHIKSIFRPQLFLASSCHYPLESPNHITTAVNSSGDTYSPYHTSLEPGIGPTSIVRKAGIVHYHHKSFPEFIWKTSRNLADRPRNTSEVIDIARLTGYAGHYFAATEETHETSLWIDSIITSDLFKDIYRDIENDPVINLLTEECLGMVRARASYVANSLLDGNSELSRELTTLLRDAIYL